MNENDLNGNGPQAPILSPETLAPKKVETPVVPEASIAAPEKTPSGKKHGKAILIGVLATVVVAGGVTLAILSGAGVFAKAKEPVSEESSSITENGGQSDVTSSTAPNPKHVYVTSLSQVTDEQVKLMEKASQGYFQEDLESFAGDLKDKIKIDEMKYLGMLLADTGYSNDPSNTENIVEMVYQVELTDNTGDEAVKRQFFWRIGYPVYQDGKVLTDRGDRMWGIICFDNWSMNGQLDIDYLYEELDDRYKKREDGVDKTLIKPYVGESKKPHFLVNSIDQITTTMKEQFQKAGDMWLKLFQILPGVQVDGVRVETVEYAGIGVGASPDGSANSIYVFYKMNFVDLNETPPKKRSVYWFISFEGIFADGHIQTSSSSVVAINSGELREWLNGPASVKEVREFIQREEIQGWKYEDDLEKELGENPEKDSGKNSGDELGKGA